MDNGGSPIDSYRLELKNSTGTTEQVVTTGGAAHFHSLESLLTNTSYTWVLGYVDVEKWRVDIATLTLKSNAIRK